MGASILAYFAIGALMTGFCWRDIERCGEPGLGFWITLLAWPGLLLFEVGVRIRKMFG